VPRQTFEAELAALKERLLHLGAMVADAQRFAVRSLAERDEGAAYDVIAQDQAINRLQHEIDEECVFLIASQQPVARDLRMIMAVSAIASELERMADHAKGIAKLALRLIDQPMLKPLIDIPRMAQIGRELLSGELRAFLSGDMDTARGLASRDDEVDQLNDQVFRELLLIMMNDPRTITRATYLLWVAHNLERYSDRAINIGERVVFVTQGDIVELND
jgi:phosphate transport system protein